MRGETVVQNKCSSVLFCLLICLCTSQFEDYVMDICFEVLDKSKESHRDTERRSDPVYLSRIISDMVRPRGVDKIPNIKTNTTVYCVSSCRLTSIMTKVCYMVAGTGHTLVGSHQVTGRAVWPSSSSGAKLGAEKSSTASAGCLLLLLAQVRQMIMGCVIHLKMNSSIIKTHLSLALLKHTGWKDAVTLWKSQ